MAVTSDHQPIMVTAHLRGGISMDLPYGLDLAGMIAARMRTLDRAALADTGRLLTSPLPDTTAEEPEDLNLPLARCTTGDDWHWMASCAIPVDAETDPEPRTFYRTVDSRWAQHAAHRPLPYHHPSKGPYRDMMMPAPVVMCSAVRWQAVGDPAAVERLLGGMRFIGRRRAVGEGRVLDWQVQTVDVDPTTWGHLDGQDIHRPCPVECAEGLGVPYRVGWYAIRPPSWHPDRLTNLAMTPEPEDEW